MEIEKRSTKWNNTAVLTVRIESFSYRKGYPQEHAGNGGGFVFDCRCMHNPGRYDEYKKLTGRDEAVIHFLEEKGEVQIYLSSVFGLVDMAVAKYLHRGFTDLSICFGCTGGQHRSVYCADLTARYIKKQYPNTTISLCHREQDIEETL